METAFIFFYVNALGIGILGILLAAHMRLYTKNQRVLNDALRALDIIRVRKGR